MVTRTVTINAGATYELQATETDDQKLVHDALARGAAVWTIRRYRGRMITWIETQVTFSDALSFLIFDKASKPGEEE
jgi:hypothetical protein